MEPSEIYTLQTMNATSVSDTSLGRRLAPEGIDNAKGGEDKIYD